MDTVQTFFQREFSHLEHNISQIEKALHEKSMQQAGPRRCAGEEALLRMQQRHRELLQQLADHATSLDEALTLCRLRLIAAEAAHAHITARGGAADLRHADSWWDTLDDIEYLAALNSRLHAAALHNGKG
jgi:hypothetical protein